MPNVKTSSGDLAIKRRPLDPRDPDYLAFVAAYLEIRSRQDFYLGAQHGFAGIVTRQTADPILLGAREADAEAEFVLAQRDAARLVRPLIALVSVNGKRVLDLGCGTGATAVALARSGALVTAADSAQESLRACRYRAKFYGVPEKCLKLIKIEAQPPYSIADQEFDIVISNSVLEFIPSRRDTHVRELIRAIASGGHLLIHGSNGWFPRDCHSGMWLPTLRAPSHAEPHLPFGPTAHQIREWVTSSNKNIVDLSKAYYLQSMTNNESAYLNHSEQQPSASDKALWRLARATIAKLPLSLQRVSSRATHLFRVVG